jgi:hypothetical protein
MNFLGMNARILASNGFEKLRGGVSVEIPRLQRVIMNFIFG